MKKGLNWYKIDGSDGASSYRCLVGGELAFEIVHAPGYMARLSRWSSVDDEERELIKVGDYKTVAGAKRAAGKQITVDKAY